MDRGGINALSWKLVRHCVGRALSLAMRTTGREESGALSRSGACSLGPGSTFSWAGRHVRTCPCSVFQGSGAMFQFIFKRKNLLGIPLLCGY